MSSPPIFWNLNYEVYTAIVEAMNDLMLLVGRPTQTLQQSFTLAINSPWQIVPKGVFVITDIWGAGNKLKKFQLYDYDYQQCAWDSSWESDSNLNGALSWAPIGFNMFVVHPAPAAPQTVLLDGIAYPVAESLYPPNGTELVPFHDEFFELLEEYTAHVLRLKEAGQDFQESIKLYQSYLEGAHRMSEIESRKDDLIFSTSFGAQSGLHSRVRR